MLDFTLINIGNYEGSYAFSAVIIYGFCFHMDPVNVDLLAYPVVSANSTKGYWVNRDMNLPDMTLASLPGKH
jgi:hypothetical protein